MSESRRSAGRLLFTPWKVCSTMKHMNKVAFEKPDLPELTREFTTVDLHVHTIYSDGMNTPEQIAERAGELGIGVAITDHNDIRGAVEICKYKNLFTIPGIEITCREGAHILVYFYDIKSLKRFFKKDVAPFMGHSTMSATSLTPEDVIRRARAFRCVIIFPHPYCGIYAGIQNTFFDEERQGRLFEMVDGVEVINAGNMNKWNLKCAVLGFNLDKAITAGSDAHSLNHIGKAVTYAPCKKTRKGFLNALKKKKNKVVGKEIHFFRKVTSNGMKLRSNLRNCPNLMEKNLRYSFMLINSKSKILKENVKRSLNDRFRKASLYSSQLH